MQQLRNIAELYQGQLWQARDMVFYVLPSAARRGREQRIEGTIKKGDIILVLDAWETEYQEPCIVALYHNQEILFTCDIAHLFKLDLECNEV